jgi:hypothetical protein
MSPVELYEGFRWAYRETFKLRRILARTITGGRLFPITFVGNLAYRIFVRRLDRGKGFELPAHTGPALLRAPSDPPVVSLVTGSGCGRRATGTG